MVELSQTEIGTWPVKEFPVKFSETPPYMGGMIDRHGPNYGEDNEYVYGSLLGISKQESSDWQKLAPSNAVKPFRPNDIRPRRAYRIEPQRLLPCVERDRAAFPRARRINQRVECLGPAPGDSFEHRGRTATRIFHDAPLRA